MGSTCSNSTQPRPGTPLHARYGMVLEICRKRLANPHDAHDACQTVFLKHAQRLNVQQPPFESDEHEKAWLIHTAITTCIDLERANRAHPTCSLETPANPDSQQASDPNPADPAAELERKELAAQVRAAVDELPPAQRDVVYLHYYGGLPVQDIARLTGDKPNAVSQRLARARAKLRSSKRLAIALLLLAALAVGAGGLAVATSTGVLGLTTITQRLFGEADVQPTPAAQLGTPVGISQTADDITVTLDTVAGDGAYAMCVFSVARADGAPLGHAVDPATGNPAPYFQSITAFIDDTQVAAFDLGAFDTDTGDETIQFALCLVSKDADASIHGGYARIYLLDLLDSRWTSTRTDAPQTLAQGPWIFEFVLDYTQLQDTVSLTLPAGQSLSFANVEATVEQLVVTPFRLHVEFATSTPFISTDEFLNPAQEAKRLRFFEQPVTYVLHNGTVVDLRGSEKAMGWTSFTPPQAHGDASMTCYATQLVSLDDIAYVTIGTLAIPVTITPEDLATRLAGQPDASLQAQPDPQDAPAVTGPFVTPAQAAEYVLGIPVAQQDPATPLAYAPGLSCTDGDVTVTLDAILGDEYQMTCVFSVIKTDGSPVYAWHNPRAERKVVTFTSMHAHLLSNSILSPHEMLGGGGGSVDFDPNDNAFQIVTTHDNSGESLAGRTVSVYISSFTNEHGEVVHPGTWAFEFVYDPPTLADTPRA